LNQEGQAYSTFKLLIAAIVAMAILAILIPIIMQVMGLIKANPTDEAKSLMSSLIDAPGSMRITKEVSFAPGTDISGSALAERVSVSQDQICMSTGDFETADSGEPGFECLNCDESDASQQRMIFSGSGERVVKIAIVCNKWLGDSSGLAQDLVDYKLDEGDGDPNIVEACEKICSEGGKCCALVLKRA